MKEQNKQIFSMLKAFDKKEVLQAIELYKDGLKNENRKVQQELKDTGWKPQDVKPDNREYYFFDNQYWVKTESARQAEIKKIKTKMNAQKTVTAKKYTGQKMDLSITDIACPKCQSKMYKQSVCAKCTEGKKGFKIRLICEDNPDHEVLL